LWLSPISGLDTSEERKSVSSCRKSYHDFSNVHPIEQSLCGQIAEVVSACVLTHLLHCSSCVGNVYINRVGFDIITIWQTATDVLERFGGRAESWDGVERSKRMTGNFSSGSVATVLSSSLFCLKPRCFGCVCGNSFAPVFDHSMK